MKRTYLFFLIAILFSISSYSQNKSEYNVGFLLDKNSPEIEFLLNNLENEISAVVGEDAVINFSNTKRLVNDFDIALAEQNYNAFLNSEVDIIIAFGVINNKIISKKKSFYKPTILFGSTSQELLETIDAKVTSKIENFITIISNQSYTNDLRVFKQIANIKNVGVFFETEFLENESVQNVFTDIEKESLTIQPSRKFKR